MLKTEFDSLRDLFANLDQDDIQSEFYSKTFYKGLGYYEDGRVDEVVKLGANTLEAQVNGSRRYTVRLELQDNLLHNDCSCPIGGFCKHVVSVLLFCMSNFETLKEQKEFLFEVDEKEKVEQYLKSLSKQELIELVMNYAPQNFKDQLKFSSLDSDQSKKLLMKIKEAIDGFYEDYELLYDPISFEAALVGQFEKLQGIWNKLPQETEDLIVEVINKLDDLMCEGLLYDHYYDNIFEGDDFSDIVRKFILSLHFEIKMPFISRLEGILSEMGYSSFEGILRQREQLFSDTEIPELKSYVLEQVRNNVNSGTAKYYAAVSGQMTVDERLLTLKTIYHASEALTLELVELYKSMGMKEESVEVMEAYLAKSGSYYQNTEKVYIELLELKKDLGHDLHTTARAAITSDPSLLELAISYLPKDQNELENLVKTKNPHSYLQYLEGQQRIGDAVVFIEQDKQLYEEEKYQFFKRNMKACSAEATSYFIGRIKLELEYTGDDHYYKIADCLRALKTLDKSKALSLTEGIRSEYKRRRNLMSIISGI